MLLTLLSHACTPRMTLVLSWACLTKEIRAWYLLEGIQEMSQRDLPFTCEDDGVLLDLDTAVHIILLSLVRDTYRSDSRSANGHNR